MNKGKVDMYFRLPRRFTEEDYYRIYRDPRDKNQKAYTLRLTEWEYVETDTEHLRLPHVFPDQTEAFTETPDDHPVILANTWNWLFFGDFLEAIVGSQCPMLTEFDMSRIPFDLPPEDSVQYDLPSEDA